MQPSDLTRGIAAARQEAKAETRSPEEIAAARRTAYEKIAAGRVLLEELQDLDLMEGAEYLQGWTATTLGESIDAMQSAELAIRNAQEWDDSQNGTSYLDAMPKPDAPDCIGAERARLLTEQEAYACIWHLNEEDGPEANADNLRFFILPHVCRLLEKDPGSFQGAAGRALAKLRAAK